ncbi:MAG: RNA polymerase sigma factor [Candidatus Hydrogenedentes bacterium]|nr:RNA polymerase sigma factor [Candidatus Hydrogenedentota bacterium]
MRKSEENTNSFEYDRCSDEELALLWKKGNIKAFEEIARRHQGKLYATAYQVTGNREDALDVTQEVLLKAYEKIHQWEPRGSFLPWLIRLTINRSIDYLRKRKRTSHETLIENIAKVDEEEANIHHTKPSPLMPGEVVRAKEIDERIREALTKLSRTQQTVFILRHYKGYSLNEIAEHLGCTVGSVKVHLFRAIQKLRKELGNLDL